MNSDSMFIEGNDGKKIFVHCWNKVENPKGAVQIFHGMGEHGKRYENFALFLNKHKYIVFADDHRGHGKTTKSVKELGFIGSDGFNRIVEDEHILTNKIKEMHYNLPVFILGHSFGSFLAQEYITKYSRDISGVIFSGSTAKIGPEVNMGFILTNMNKGIFGSRNRSMFIEWLCFGSFNRYFKESNSKFAWLTRDKDIVKKYVDDPFCGIIYPVSFYYYFFKALCSLYRPDKLKRIQKLLPIYILSGDMDPVGSYGKGVKKLFEIYREFELENVEIKLYNKYRHEIINEINNKEVYNDILKFIEDNINIYK